MSIDSKVTNNISGSNQKKLIELSKNLGLAYYPGLNNEKAQGKTDSWNANKFIEMSRCLSSAYGVDF